MPQFLPGATKVATLSFPVSPSGLSCTVELFLTKDGVTKVATSGPVSFVSTGAAQNMQASIVLPSTGDTYKVYIDVVSGSIPIGAYQATDNVIISAPQLPFAYTFSCTLGVCPSATAWGIAKMNGTIKNNNSVRVSQNVKVMWSRWSRTYGKWVACVGGLVSTREYCTCNLSPCMVNPFPIELAPGGLQVFTYAGHCESGGICAPMLERNFNFYFWLEDDAGGKSDEVMIST